MGAATLESSADGIVLQKPLIGRPHRRVSYRGRMTDDLHEKSKAIWGEMAQGWERTRSFMSRTTGHVTSWLVDNVGAGVGDTTLDLAGGPGDNGFAAAERVGPSGRVIETDFAPQMVDAARRGAVELGLENVETRVLDAQNMDLAEDSVDGVICRWGFMLMIDPESALRECRRVLRPGRRLAASVWGGPEKNPWVTISGMTMMQLGHQPPGDPFGPGGLFSMADESTIRSMVSNAGFADVHVEEMAVDWSYDSFDHAWDFMTQVAGPIATVINKLPAESVEELRAALEKNVEPYRTGSGLTLPGITVNFRAE
jgi:ubiquinone/menaquinone biosynthesis C-methylase UbiE